MSCDGKPKRATTLDDLLAPKSIAIVGASDDKRRIGGRPLPDMIEQKFDGAVYPVNARRETVQGVKAYPSVDEMSILSSLPSPRRAYPRLSARPAARTPKPC